MFTGIVEEIGEVIRRNESEGGVRLIVGASLVLNETNLGDSIMVDGVCLTATELSKNYFQAFVSKTTLETTTFGQIQIGKRVHLERAMTPKSRFGGHMMSGHIDGKGTIKELRKEGEIHYLTISFPDTSLDGMPFSTGIVEKGSIGIDGVSLTVVGCSDTEFWVTLIPETSKRTLLCSKKIGDNVNLEIEMLAKYVQKAVANLNSNASKSKISMSKLQEMGF